jgi:hypothetical protein
MYFAPIWAPARGTTPGTSLADDQDPPPRLVSCSYSLERQLIARAAGARPVLSLSVAQLQAAVLHDRPQGVLARHSEFEPHLTVVFPVSFRPFPSIPRPSIASSPSLATNPHCVAQYSPVEASFRDRWLPSYPIYFWTRHQPLGSSRPYLSAIAAVCLPHHFNSCLSPSIVNSNSSSTTKQTSLDGKQLVTLVGRGLETSPPGIGAARTCESCMRSTLFCASPLPFSVTGQSKAKSTSPLTNQPYI